jgi:hypothetical protein
MLVRANSIPENAGWVVCAITLSPPATFLGIRSDRTKTRASRPVRILWFFGFILNSFRST